MLKHTDHLFVEFLRFVLIAMLVSTFSTESQSVAIRMRAIA